MHHVRRDHRPREAPALGMPEVAAKVQEFKKEILKTVIKGSE